jgi:hypothetical protein
MNKFENVQYFCCDAAFAPATCAADGDETVITEGSVGAKTVSAVLYSQHTQHSEI